MLEIWNYRYEKKKLLRNSRPLEILIFDVFFGYNEKVLHSHFQSFSLYSYGSQKSVHASVVEIDSSYSAKYFFASYVLFIGQ